MRIKVLGCHGGVVSNYQTSCYWINEAFLIDAGSVCSALSLEDQGRITDVLITHPHLDHIKDLAFLFENTYSPHSPPVRLRSSAAILEDVHRHLFNDVIWPDFSKISNEKGEMLQFLPFKDKLTLGDCEIVMCPVSHPGHAVGFIIDDGKKQVVFTGDSGPTEKLWKLVNKLPNLAAIFTEISFPTRMNALATASGHFAVEPLLDELGKIHDKEVPIYISHFKPMFFEELLEEYHSKAPNRMRLLHQNDEIIL
jgi:cAMP phosphodiesterase